MEAFKHKLDEALVRDMGRHLQRASPALDRARFEAVALAGLDQLELKARAHRIADALEAVLPDDFGGAAAVLEASLGPAGIGDDLSLLRTGESGLAGWAVWPMTEFVARRGHGDVPRALAALHAMTQRFSAEWAVRPFLLHHPDLAFATLMQWTRDPSPHVRRLASEGSRPRLPWGAVLKPLVADPAPTLPLLRALQDDPSAYVRRSVANHLNDIAKDHPTLVVQWLSEHLPGASPERRALLRHASRTLVKRGHAGVLAAWGLGRPLKGEATLALGARNASVGDTLGLAVTLHSRSRQSQTLELDYAVHHVKADGGTTAKVFKGWRVVLGPGEERALHKRHSLKPVTTRRYHAGRHRIELLCNGRAVAEAAFVLSASA
jgi:3-methyladenine DNA glycosylase AlkC